MVRYVNRHRKETWNTLDIRKTLSTEHFCAQAELPTQSSTQERKIREGTYRQEKILVKWALI